jgi:2-amino-4-hydroxy-6-hydroxymethyldihydropteridine diphosphokinase
MDILQVGECLNDEKCKIENGKLKVRSAKVRFKFKDSREIIKVTFFPDMYKSSDKKNTALIGIGCNIGNCIRRFKKLYLFLSSYPKIDIVKTSIIYKNPPFGYLNQNDFYNTIMIIKTNFSPMELLNFLLFTEKKFRRKRSFKNSPRTLDLDIIMFNEVKMNKKRLILPHPFFKQRDSVLIPLILKDY